MKHATLLTMIFFLFFGCFLSGCSQMKVGEIMDGVETATNIAGTVCGAAPLFSDQLARPAEKCQKVIDAAAKIKNEAPVSALVGIASCVEDYRKDKLKLKLIDCIDAVNGAKIVIERIEKIKD